MPKVAVGGQTEVSAPACDKSLRVHLDLHAPSAYLNSQAQVEGMDADMAYQILTRAGCKVSWHLQPMTGARIIRSLQDGHFDVMIRASNTPERQQYAYFSTPYRQEVVGVFSLKESGLEPFLTLDSALAQKLRLIGPASGWYGEYFEQLRKRWRESGLYTSYPDAAKATELLFATPSRGELVLVDADIFFHHLGRERHHLVQLMKDRLMVTPAHLMVRKNAVEAEDLLAINQAIQDLREEGVLAGLENRYRPVPLQQMLQTRKDD